jgi:thiamine-phosphate pyrophosphorylase
MARLDPRRLGVYVVTSDTGPGHREIATAALKGGATAIQLRAPELADGDLEALATSLVEMCGDAGVPLVVNDRVDIAIGSGAAGAHVGQDDDPGTARGRLGPERVLGVSVMSAEQAWVAEMAGADYLGVTVWATATKPEAVAIGLDGLRHVAGATVLPVVGIGGIDESNAREVLAAGAAGIAVIGAVASAEDPVEAVRALRTVVDDFYDESPR